MAEADTVLPDVQDDNAPPAPIDIDIESGEVSDAGTPPPAPVTPPARAAIPRPQARIRELTQEVHQHKSYAQQVAEENRLLKEENAREKSARENAERAGMENYAGRVKGDLDSAAEELRRAKDAGDTAAEVAAQTKLAKAAAADSDIEAWRATLPKDPPAQAPQPQPQQPQQRQQPQQEQPLSEGVLDFATENRWFDAVQRDAAGHILYGRDNKPVANPDFNPRAHNAAMLIHNDILARIEDGEIDETYIETPEYFQEIADGVKARFPKLAGEGQQQQQPARRNPPMAPARQAVAPASRSGMPGQNNGAKSSTKVRLNSEEVELVNRMVDNGTMRYPRNHADPNKRGQKMEYKDAYLDYAKRAQETRQ